MSLSRYFIEFSYNGSKFSGVAKQKNTPFTVHNVIQTYLHKSLTSLTLNETDKHELKSDIKISSRTDAGVHAVSNTAHFDLESTSSNLGLYIKECLNKHFIQNRHFIRILNCQQVSPDFIARHAKSRTYLYRLALLNNGRVYWTEVERYKKVERCLNNKNDHYDFSIPHLYPLSNFSSIIDNGSITEIREPFDRDLFNRAVDVYNGKHDFSAFTTKAGREEVFAKRKSPVKNVQTRVSFEGEQFLSDYLHSYDEKYKIIDVEIKAESFMYKMIRKMIGAAVDVARGTIKLDQIASMLYKPSDFYDKDLTTILKPNGLYLKNVEYDKI